MLLRIVANTPVWVWILLLALFILGIIQSRPRAMTLRRTLILPTVMTGLSIAGTISTFGVAPSVLLTWSLTAGTVAWLVGRRPVPARIRYDPNTGVFHLPGSVIPLLLILGIFLVKYMVGVMLAIQPVLSENAGFILLISSLYGAMSGIFVGRAARLWQVSRRPGRASSVPGSVTASPLRIALGVAGGIIALIVLAIAVMIAFGTANPPAPLTAVTGAVMNAEYCDLPPLESFTARDGTSLAYRIYRGKGDDRVAVLVHGSSGDSHAMHAVGLTLAKAGITAYALDIRGHGASGRKGDIDYIGQLDDDIADIVTQLRDRHPKAQLTMIGHSSGGGFALRTAGGCNHDLFDRYVLLAPLLHQDAPTTRPNAGGWVQPFVMRIIGLDILDRLGVPWFQHLPVLAFALPPEVSGKATMTYSYRLQLSFRPHADYMGDVRAITRPTKVMVGAGDELFIADQYAPLLKPAQEKLRVMLLPGVTHIGIVVQPEALAAIVAEL